MRGVPREHLMMYQQYMRVQQETIGHGARMAYHPRYLHFFFIHIF